MEFLSKRKYIEVGLAVGVGLMALTGCAEEELDRSRPGIVVEKEYDDPDTWVVMTKAGKTTVPVTRHDPAHWYLTIEQCDHEDLVSDENPKGCGKFEEEVSESIYSDFQIGDTVTLSQ